MPTTTGGESRRLKGRGIATGPTRSSDSLVRELQQHHLGLVDKAVRTPPSHVGGYNRRLAAVSFVLCRLKPARFFPRAFYNRSCSHRVLPWGPKKTSRMVIVHAMHREVSRVKTGRHFRTNQPG
jgi:hypothetical protein